jgi:(p)ppGpp synthase/HD superfamily hydrolase
MKDLERALLVAEMAHANQKYDIYPYIYHIKQVVGIAEELGFDKSILVASALHDTLEDTDMSFNDIKRAFGEEVAEIVFAVTDELGRNRKERKSKTYPKIKANWKATVVKICDRIANMSHSKDYNTKMFEMYKKEHQDFCDAIKSDYHPQNEVKKAWSRLEILINS